MRILRIVAGLVTGTLMFAGGIVLTMTGPAAIVFLGVFSAVVGVLHTYAGLAAERASQRIVQPPSHRATRSYGIARISGFLHLWRG